MQHRHPVSELDRRYLAGSEIDLEHLTAALRSSREWWQAIFEAAGIGILLGDDAGRILATNGSLDRMLGYSEDELRAVGIADITHPDDLAADLQLFMELQTGQRDHYQLEKRYIRKDGSVMWGLATVLLLKDEKGLSRFGIALLQDVSSSKRSEETQERLEAAIGHQRQAVELNDEVVQGLAVAKLALQSGDEELALRTLDSTLTSARTIVARLLAGAEGAGARSDGYLVRDAAAEVTPIKDPE